MSVSLEELKKNNSGNNYEKGYRIVYFYDNYYKVGEYCRTIDGFMIGFAKCDPVSVTIYDVNGTCIDKVYRKKCIN